MSFISPEFVIFFSVVIPIFFLIRHRFRWVFLLAVSYLFYAFGTIEYLPLIMISTAVDYVAAQRIYASELPRTRKLWLIVSILVNLGILSVFKYLDFFGSSIGAVVGYVPPSLNLVLPVGISFYTFQSMSYTIDVYQGKIAPARHPGIFATYVSFFPQLVAGPIERAGNLLPQFKEKSVFDISRTVSGLQLILWGFFKKVVIADRIAIYVNTVHGDLHNYTGEALLLAMALFSFQIYCDFSSYTDIAIGTARIIGFDLIENFRQPYFATSVGDFWRRWHMSLGSWFRDYIYIPLGGSRVPLPRHMLNLMIVFFLTGMWHGAGWTFIIWGCLHGTAVSLQVFMRRMGWKIFPEKETFLTLGVKMLLTFSFVTFTRIFFRSTSIEDAFYIIQHLFVFDPGTDLTAMFAGGLLGAQVEFVLSIALIIGLLGVDAMLARAPLSELFARTPLVLRWGLYYAMGFAVVFSGLYGTGAQQFIYFQF